MSILGQHSALPAVALALAACSGAAQANYLGLSQPGLMGYADMFLAGDSTTAGINTTYNTSTSSFQATGAATQITFSNALLDSTDITGGTFSLDAMIDASGAISGATLAINGSFWDSLGTTQYSGNLLSGTLASNTVATGLGLTGPFAVRGNHLDFLFTVKGGSATSLFASNVGVNLDLGTAPDFTQSFTRSNGTADAASVVPLPAAAWLFGSAMVGMSGLGLRRRRGADAESLKTSS